MKPDTTQTSIAEIIEGVSCRVPALTSTERERLGGMLINLGDLLSGTTTDLDHLLSGVDALVKPKYGEINKHAGRNDRLLHACLCAYAKHQLDCEDIGWDRLGDILMDAICNEIGDIAFVKWGERVKNYE
jgi:hypothetical protein